MASHTQEPQFDLEAAYDERIAPLMTQIIDICEEVKMPMMATFCYFNDPEDKVQTGESRSFCTTNIPRDGWQPRQIGLALREIFNGGSAISIITVTKDDQ